MSICPICKKNKTNIMKMYVPSYYITGFGIERLEPFEVCPECGTNLMFLSENAGENVTIDQKNNAVDYFAECIDGIADPEMKRILIDYINQEPYNDPDPEATKAKRDASIKQTRKKSILMSMLIFLAMGGTLFYVSDIIDSWILKLASIFLIAAGFIVMLLPFLKKLTK